MDMGLDVHDGHGNGEGDGDGCGDHDDDSVPKKAHDRCQYSLKCKEKEGLGDIPANSSQTVQESRDSRSDESSSRAPMKREVPKRTSAV